MAYSRTANKRGRPGEEEKEYMEKEKEGEEGEAEPCPAWDVTCRLENLLMWWRNDGVGRETRVKAALRREVLPAGNKRWRNAEGMSGFTRALVATVSANDGTEPGQREREGGHHGVWDFCMRMAASPESTERKGRTQESEDGAIQEVELPRSWWLFTGGNARDDDGGTPRDAPYTGNVPPGGDVKHSGGEENRREHGRKSGAS